MNELTRTALRPDRAITDPMPLRDPGIAGALVPATAAEAMEMAKMISSGKFAIPNYLQDNPGDCLRIVLVAARSRLDPFMLANESYLTKSTKTGENRMEFMAKAVHAITLASGILRGDLETKIEGEGTNLSCTVTGQRREGRTHTETYYIRTIEPKNSPLWKTQPRQQLIYYAERAWCRAHAPDALMGLIAREDPPIDVTPQVVTIDGETDRGALSQVEAHLAGEEAATEQGRDTREGLSSPAPEREGADSAGQPDSEGDYVGKEFNLPPEEPNGISERLAGIKAALGKQESLDALDSMLAEPMLIQTVAGLDAPEAKTWREMVKSHRDALDSMA